MRKLDRQDFVSAVCVVLAIASNVACFATFPKPRHFVPTDRDCVHACLMSVPYTRVDEFNFNVVRCEELNCKGHWEADR